MHPSLLAATMIVPVMLTFGPTAAGGAVPGTGPTPASPRSPDDTHCTVDYIFTLDPGFSMSPGSGTYTTSGETGTLTCDGTVDGHKVTGPGTYGEDGQYGTSGPNSCTNFEGQAEGTVDLTLPTDAGPVHIPTTMHVDYGPLRSGGLAGGTFDGPRFYGTFTAMALDGDCVTKPLTKFRGQIDAFLSSEPSG